MMTDVRMERARTESLVGREAELSALLRDAGRDGTRMVLVSGDAGVGKTRVLTEALDRLTAEGWTCLVGHCLDFGEASMPYLPFAEVLGQVAQAQPELAAQLAATHPAFARLRPADRHRRVRRDPRPGRGLRGRPRPARRAQHALPGRARGRGRPLGRREHPRPDQLPALAPLRRALPGCW